MNAEQSTNPACLREVVSPEDLREFLDQLNESGNTPVTVGIDNFMVPFLVTLVGPYVDGEHVLIDSPWQTDIDWVKGEIMCEECQGRVFGISYLHYPVVVVRSAQS